MPVVLRQVEDREREQKYQLVSVCHVVGALYGEVWTSEDRKVPGNLLWSRISLGGRRTSGVTVRVKYLTYLQWWVRMFWLCQHGLEPVVIF